MTELKHTKNEKIRNICLSTIEISETRNLMTAAQDQKKKIHTHTQNAPGDNGLWPTKLSSGLLSLLCAQVLNFCFAKDDIGGAIRGCVNFGLRDDK